jgi:hypothetical protein
MNRQLAWGRCLSREKWRHQQWQNRAVAGKLLDQKLTGSKQHPVAVGVPRRSSSTGSVNRSIIVSPTAMVRASIIRAFDTGIRRPVRRLGGPPRLAFLQRPFQFRVAAANSTKSARCYAAIGMLTRTPAQWCRYRRATNARVA